MALFPTKGRPAMTSPEPLKTAFWQALSESPFVMLELKDRPDGAAPMTAQLDPDADGAIWFFTARSGHFAPLGPAHATFVSKDHQLFARFAGHLVEETSAAVRERFWTSEVAAWFPGGETSPEVLLMRMELGAATIWGGDLGLVGSLKLMLGLDVQKKTGEKLDTHL